MGGNVTIDSKTADKIDIRVLSVSAVRDDLSEFIEEFKGKFGSNIVPSGSTVFLFDKTIDERELKAHKPVFGDIDFQIDENRVPSIPMGLCIGKFEFIGSKKTTNTLVTLWAYQGLNVQIDFEGVKFTADDEPEPWSRFAYSAAWEDQLEGIKGVAHKYIFRALTARWLTTYPIKTKTGIKEVKTSRLAFSNKGLRVKLVPYDDHGGWEELKTSESVYHTDLSAIYALLFDSKVPFTRVEANMMRSYKGVLQLIKLHVPESDWKAIEKGMANLLWGPNAQRVSKDDLEDKVAKIRIMLAFCSALNSNFAAWDTIQQDYYGTL